LKRGASFSPGRESHWSLSAVASPRGKLDRNCVTPHLLHRNPDRNRHRADRNNGWDDKDSRNSNRNQDNADRKHRNSDKDSRKSDRNSRATDKDCDHASHFMVNFLSTSHETLQNFQKS
jgi:hypothetical protein